MQKLLTFILIAVVSASCGNNSGSDSKNAVSTDKTTASTPTTTDPKSQTNPSYDPHRGEGKYTKVDIGASLDAPKADGGKKVYDVKCSGCHKVTDEKLVGPGWAGVTSRHSPEWIMNFITNTDEMITKDPKAQALLEICLVRMPNQNLTDVEARDLFEFMRKIDGVK